MPFTTHSFHNHLFAFDEGSLGMHENLMPCVIVGKQRPVIVSNDTQHIEAEIVCITPGLAHRVAVRRGGADIIYLDGVDLAQSVAPFCPLSSDWRALPAAFEQHDHHSVSEFRAMLDASSGPHDQSVMQIVSRLYDDPFTRLSQMDLAQALNLERSQALRHFKATTGQTFRKFKIWAGIVAATRMAMGGTQIGHAGVEAGFSDAAHLTRTASSVFGTTPTKGLSGLNGMQTMIGTAP